MTSSDYSRHWCQNPIFRCSGSKRLTTFICAQQCNWHSLLDNCNPWSTCCHPVSCELTWDMTYCTFTTYVTDKLCVCWMFHIFKLLYGKCIRNEYNRKLMEGFFPGGVISGFFFLVPLSIQLSLSHEWYCYLLQWQLFVTVHILRCYNNVATCNL